MELAELLRAAILQRKVHASWEQWKVINDLINCRTQVLGGHLYECTSCGAAQPQYNSCRNRHCPKCQGAEIAEWLSNRADELLDVPYFHLVFTVPHEFNTLILQNKAVVLDVLFKAVAKSLKDVTRRALGGKIGFFSVLHTWGGKLDLHPHIHCVIPGVVLKPDGIAERTRQNYFVSRKKLAIVFRAVFLKLLRKAFTAGKLSLRPGEDEQCFIALLLRCASAEWIVYAKRPFAGPQVVLKYLSRYTHRVAISNGRIKDFRNDRVVFSYRDRTRGKGNKKTTCSLELAEFVRRFLLHVLPKQFVRIRYYGFLANGKRAKALSKLKVTFGQTSAAIAAESRPPKCSCCGSSTLRHLRELPPIKPPGSDQRQHNQLPSFT